MKFNNFLKPNTRGAEQRLRGLLAKMPSNSHKEVNGEYQMSEQLASDLYELMTSEGQEGDIDWGTYGTV